MFKKTCFECGSKVDEVYEGLCSKCYKQINPPIKEVKPLNLKYCNHCKKIHYNNQLISREEVEKRLPDMVKKSITIDDKYELNNIEIENFSITGATVHFDIEVDCKLKKKK